MARMEGGDSHHKLHQQPPIWALALPPVRAYPNGSDAPLEQKLRTSAHLSISWLALPIDPSALPQPIKHKSIILNMLSCLASPASKSTGAC